MSCTLNYVFPAFSKPGQKSINNLKMLSDTDSMNIFNARSLIKCTTHDEDDNAINLKFIVSCKKLADYFLPTLKTQ